MSTIKQKRALNKIVENGGNISKSMRQAGYSPRTAKTPKKLTESDGFKDLLKASGLDENLIIESLVEDIKNKPCDRIRELTLGAELLGLRKKASLIETDDRYLPIPIMEI